MATINSPFMVDQIVLRHLKMPLVHFFETSFSRTYARDIILVEVRSDGVSGWGEVTAGENPFYNEEWTASIWPLLRDYAAPRILRYRLHSAEDVYDRIKHIRGHFMARGGIETAIWDLQARINQRPLWQEIGGGAQREIQCGVSIGVQDTVPQLLEKIQTELDAGYRRIKIKIKPGWDVDVVRQVRERFPDILLMADANSAYRLSDIEHLRKLDDFQLMMIEQPLAHDDIIDHATLQRHLKTPICLDECIRTDDHARQAIELRACGIINIKLGRVGGFAASKRIHDRCQAANIPVWCGGMLEAGIGRAHNIALSSLPNFVLPGDVSASKRYWKRDIITPEVEVSTQGTIALRDQIGFGYDIDHDSLLSNQIREEIVQ
jgi:o-succinylbenzoate synthase